MPSWDSYSYGACPVPNAEQNLLFSVSKHLYATKTGLLRRQKKELDPRVPGDRTLLTRLLAYDRQTGVFYAELHEYGEEDLLAFLARAWIRKPDCKLQGIPHTLNVPRSLLATARLKADLDFIVSRVPVRLGPLPSGFSAGATPLRQFEIAVDDFRAYRAGQVNNKTDQMSLNQAQLLSAVISDVACAGTSFLSDKEEWDECKQAPATLFEAVDQEYEPTAAWRTYPWDWVLSGMPPKEEGST